MLKGTTTSCPVDPCNYGPKQASLDVVTPASTTTTTAPPSTTGPPATHPSSCIGQQFGLENLPTLFTNNTTIQFRYDADFHAVQAAVQDFVEKIFPLVKTQCLELMADLRKLDAAANRSPYTGAKQLCERFHYFERRVEKTESTSFFPQITTQLATQEVYPDRLAFRKYMWKSAAFQSLVTAVRETYKDIIDFPATKIYSEVATTSLTTSAGGVARAGTVEQ
eukprot:GSA120T00009523001.1